MRAVACHRLLPPPTPPPATKLLPSASTSTSNPAAFAHPTTLLASSATTAAPTAIGLQPADSPTAAFWDYQFLFASQRSESAEPIPLQLVAGSVPADFPAGTYYLAGPGLFTDDHGSTVHPLDGHGYLRAFSFDGDGGAVRYTARFVETQAQREEREEGTGRWRFTHRGPFSVLRGGKRAGNLKVMKNVANTSVLRWGERLLCLWEGGDPYEIDPRSLGTVGPLDLIGRERHDGDRKARRWWELAGGRPVADFGVTKSAIARASADLVTLGVDVAAHFLKPVLHGVFNMPPKRMLAHYKIDPKRNRLLVLSCNAEDLLLPRSNFTFYEFNCNFELKQKKEFVIPDHLMIHDWAFTDDHYVLLGNRIKLDAPGSLLAISGLHPMITALSVNPSRQSTPVYLLPRSSESAKGGRDWRVPIEAPSRLWSLHVGNAFEERDEVGNLNIQLQASVCSYQWFNFQKMFGYNWHTGRLDPSFMNMAEGKEELLPHLVQISIELDTSGECRRCTVNSVSKQWNRPTDFPVINPALSGQRNAYIYAGSASGSRRFLPHFPFDSVVKINCSDGSATSWSAGSRKFIGEPIFVPRGTKEDDGYILVVEYAVAKQRCYLVVLDARRIGETNALVAKFEVPKHLTFPLGFHGFWADR